MFQVFCTALTTATRTLPGCSPTRVGPNAGEKDHTPDGSRHSNARIRMSQADIISQAKRLNTSEATAPRAGDLMKSDHYIWTDLELMSWLDERLPSERMSELEQRLRIDDSLKVRLSSLIQHRDQGGHSIGEIWYRAGLSCPGRSELGGYLLGTLSAQATDYLEFHLMTIGCRLCQANLEDLREHSDNAGDTEVRRRRFFESSAGLLAPDDSTRF
ncbi:MAG: hypothetical protein MK102_10085 [Fuerstiella sp.]|nr:hypothetical protein [Fuerstiella sp.]